MRRWIQTNFLFILVALPLAAFLLTFRLGDRPLRNPDEGRYAKIASEMALSGDWIRPTLYGMEYLRKPPLYYWLLAASFKLIGMSEGAARSVGVFFALLTCLLSYVFAKKYFGIRAAALSILFLATNFWFVQIGRFLVIDMVFSFFIVSALLVFYRWFDQGKPVGFLVLFYICLGFGILSKGVLALALPGTAILVFLIYKKKLLATFFKCRPLLGISLLVVIAAPWFILMTRLEPDFWQVFFVREHWQRATLNQFEHQEAWFFYPLLLVGVFFPFSLYMPLIKKGFSTSPGANRSKEAALFLLFSILSIVLFLSLSKSKLATYILPTVPLICLLFGRAADQWLLSLKNNPKASWGALRPIMLVLLGVSALFYIVQSVYVERLGTAIPRELLGFLNLLGLCLLLGTTAGSIFVMRRKPVFFLVSQFLMMALVILAIVLGMEMINGSYTTKELAKALKPGLAATDEVFIYEHPGAFYDFGFYLKRPIKLVGLSGEMEQIRLKPRHRAYHVTRDEFYRRIRVGPKLYCLTRKSDYAELSAEMKARTRVLFQNDRKVIFETLLP